MRTGTTNEQLKGLIDELRKKSYSENIPLWLRIAEDLEKPTRQRRAVNLSRINRYAEAGETVIVPGKVLSTGNLDRSLTIAAFKFSGQALEKIKKANAKALYIADIIKESPKGKKMRIIG